MKDFLRNSRPLPYKTLATGILFNGVIEYHKEDIENTQIFLDNIKDGVTILYFNKDIKEVVSGNVIVSLSLTLQDYERVIFGPVYMMAHNEELLSVFDGLSYYDDTGNYASILIAKNNAFVQQWDITIDGKEYKDGMPVLINKIGGLIFVEFYTEI